MTAVTKRKPFYEQPGPKTARRETPTKIAAAVVRHWIKDFPFPQEDYAIGELTRRIASAIANYSKD